MANNPAEVKSKKIEDLLIILVKYRKIIFINVLIITIAAVIISLMIPNRYTATASFISPKKKGGLFGDIAGFSSTIKDLSKTLGGRLGTVSDEAYNYLVILQSRTASEKVIKKFNLREIYEIDNDKPYEDVIKALENNVSFNIEDEGNIVVSVTDELPKRAAEMANFYVQILNEISLELNVTESRNNREFIEKRFLQVQSDIVILEDSLKNFSKKYNVLEMKEQMKAAITVAAEIQAKAEVAKIERDLLKMNFGDDNPLVLQADLKVKEINKRLSSMKFGENENLRSSLNLFIPFENVPETGILYIRLMRDYEIQNKLLEFIYPIYEQAKIEEQKNLPVVLVVDKAISPEKKSSPKRSLIVFGAFLISFFFSLGYVLIKESYKSIQSDDVRFRKIRAEIIDPLKFTFKSKKSS
ncbi:MAG: hypothetical protein IPJ23_08740 [Ignavibacteriales bacterium]|nr:hypothetical protein [Ignavibacteriales bacterium]